MALAARFLLLSNTGNSRTSKPRPEVQLHQSYVTGLGVSIVEYKAN